MRLAVYTMKDALFHIIHSPAYIRMIGLWTLWCGLHSTLASLGVKRRIQAWIGEKGFRFYRLGFNLTALLTVLYIIHLPAPDDNPLLFGWSGWRTIPQVMLGILALCFFWGGMRQYDAQEFLGLRQIAAGHAEQALADTNEFRSGGILAFSRHPWYAGSFLVLWARDVSLATLCVNTVLSIYLVLGTLLEERKLAHEYGDAYRQYQRCVPMFWPRPRMVVRFCLRISGKGTR